MSMSKKDFIALADIIKEQNGTEFEFSDRHIEVLSRFCMRRSPRFLPIRWEMYIKGECGKNGGKVKESKIC